LPVIARHATGPAGEQARPRRAGATQRRGPVLRYIAEHRPVRVPAIAAASEARKRRSSAT
jgi:hypothetical protein